MFLYRVKKKTKKNCTAQYLDAQKLKDFENKCLNISVYLPKKIFIPKM